jgi:hypothetical protein
MLTLLSVLFAGACAAAAGTPQPSPPPPRTPASVGVPLDAPAVRRLSVDIDRIDAGALRAEGFELRLDGGATAADPLSLRVDASRLELPAAAISLSSLEWACARLLTLDPLVCEGPLRVAGRPAGALAVDLSTARTGLRWTQGRRSLAVDKDLASPWRIAAQRIPLAWLEDFTRQLWASGRIGEGSLSGRLSIPADAAATRIEGELRLSGLAFDTPDGALAGAGLEVPLRLRFAADAAQTRVSLSGRLAAGELLVSPVYVAVPAGGIGFEVDAESQPEGRWRLPRWRWDDAGTLTAEGDATVGADGSVLALAARAEAPDLAALRGRYLDGVLAPAGFGALQLGGRGRGVVAFDAEGLSALEVDLQQALAIDPTGRFSLAGVNGDLRWSRDAVVANSRLGWSAAALYGIGIEAGALAFRSQDGQLVLAEPLRTGVLGGHLRLDRFVWRPPRAAAPLRIEMGLALEALDLGSLSQRLGWPAFVGTVGGTLPNALYEGNRVRFEGGLAMQLFGGEVRIDDLALERPFGVAPSLAADLRFQDIDLAPLTGAFGFGEITGRLDGRIRDLRLVDWTPVAFDARLLTDREWDGPRRVSQRAVQDISDLGGSGLIAGLQARLLSTFDDFGYDRIGIGCVLKDNRCAMSGLRKRGDGYLVIAGRGLPRIEVVGFRRQVDWPTLVSRLEDATKGDTLRIE